MQLQHLESAVKLLPGNINSGCKVKHFHVITRGENEVLGGEGRGTASPCLSCHSGLEKSGKPAAGGRRGWGRHCPPAFSTAPLPPCAAISALLITVAVSARPCSEAGAGLMKHTSTEARRAARAPAAARRDQQRPTEQPPGCPPPSLFLSFNNVSSGAWRDGSCGASKPTKPLSAVTRGRRLVALTGCWTRDGCRQDQGWMQAALPWQHGKKKQHGSSPERWNGSGETLLLGRAQQHTSSSTGEVSGFPAPGCSTHKTPPPRQLGARCGPCAGVLVVRSLVLPQCWGAVGNCDAGCWGCAMPLIYSLQPPGF